MPADDNMLHLKYVDGILNNRPDNLDRYGSPGSPRFGVRKAHLAKDQQSRSRVRGAVRHSRSKEIRTLLSGEFMKKLWVHLLDARSPLAIIFEKSFHKAPVWR